MKNKYYIVLINSRTQSYIEGEVRVVETITDRETLLNVRNMMLAKFGYTKDFQEWLVLNWKRFEDAPDE